MINPSTILVQNQIIKAFIIKRKSPNVIMVIGNVRITKMGFTIKLSNANTTATIIEVLKLAILTPGKK
jgi:hypothetical protein